MGLESFRATFEDMVEKKNLLALECSLMVDYISYELYGAVEDLKRGMSDQGPTMDHKSILKKLKSWINMMEQTIQSLHEEVESIISKGLELLEKELDIDLDLDRYTTNFDVQILNQTIADHFFSQSMFNIGDYFIIEAGAPKDDILRSHFIEKCETLEALRTRDFQLVERWISSNREKLRNIGSRIELMFYQLRFKEILMHGSKLDALEYASANLVPLASFHEDEVIIFMSCLFWIGKLESWPYYRLLDLDDWNKFSDELTRQFCMLLGRSSNPPLAVAVEAGIEALPDTLKRLELQDKPRTALEKMIDADSSVELSDDFQFHSIFICPLSGEEARRTNPPIMLPCGHVFLWHCIVRMVFNTHMGRLFCPNCHSDITVALVRPWMWLSF